MKNQEIKQLNHSVFLIHAHLILVTKYRKKCISPRILERLRIIFKHLCENWECELLEFNAEPDHCHLLLSLNPKVQPSKLVNNFKTVSSRRLRKEFNEEISKFLWKDSFWSNSYCFVSTGGATLEVIKKYIQSQDKDSPLKCST